MSAYFDVRYVHPIRKREETGMNVPASSLHMRDGQNTYHFNNFFPACPVLELTDVTERVKMEQHYFNRFGTAAE